MLKFGFELEGFQTDGHGTVIVPTEGVPVDGGGGLVELRTTGGKELNEALTELYAANMALPVGHYRFDKTQHVFTSADRSLMRQQPNQRPKTPVKVLNAYGKQQRLLGNVRLASFQINISEQTHRSYNESINQADDRGVRIITHPARYGLLPVEAIVKALDKEFAAEIKASNRQPGMYAIKDEIRLEYRSLPNSLVSFVISEDKKLLARITKAITTGV